MNESRCRLLASVATPDEARVVMAAGADIVDIKNPAAGVLGAVTPDCARAIVQTVGGSLPVSATIGDVPMDATAIAQGIATMLDCGVDIVKVGWFGAHAVPQVNSILAQSSHRGARVVVVLFAEYGIQLHRVAELAAAGVYGIMLDTADKQSGGLRDKLTLEQLAAFSQRVQHYNLLCGLAGSLTSNDIAPLLSLDPGYLGFRGAFCHQRTRTADVDPALVRNIRSCMDTHVQPHAYAI